jgi:hypothetical protein
MPRLNRVLKELGIHHEEHKVPLEVLAMIEKKAAAKNAMAAAESKKRKGIGASMVIAKKQKIPMAGPTSTAFFVSSSAQAYADAMEVSTKNSGGV